MKKISLLLAAVLISLTFCPVVAQARASEYFMSYSANALPGNERGEIKIDFSVHATGTFSKIGALKIEIYKANGEHMTTVWGSPSNGLLSAQTNYVYGRTYTYDGVPGTSYYAKVTLCAGSLTYYETREMTTPMALAPY